MAEATKLPVKTETKTAVPQTPAGAWAPFDNFRREMDRVFNAFQPGSLGFPLSRSAFDVDTSWPRDSVWSVTPAIDVSEKDKSYEITAELPGMDDKDIDVRVSNGTLTIKGEKKEEKEEHDKGYYVSERRYGSFKRSFQLPDGVDAAKIDASFAKGVLTVRLPKTADAQQSKKVDIKAA
jgi:HSP20 family protein